MRWAAFYVAPAAYAGNVCRKFERGDALCKKGNINAIIGLLEVEPSSWGKYVDYSFGKAKDFLPQVLNKRRNDFLEMIASEITKRKHL